MNIKALIKLRVFTGWSASLLFANTPYVKNGLSHSYHLDESIFILEASGVHFHYNPFFDENHVSKQTSPRWDTAFCCVTSEAILFDKMKRTSGLYEIYQVCS